MSRKSLKFCVNICIVIMLVSVSAVAQTTQEKIEQMRIRRTELEKQVKASEELLTSTDKDINSKVNSLSTLSAQLAERRKLFENTKNDIQTLSRDSLRDRKSVV